MSIIVLAGTWQETTAFVRAKGLGNNVRHIVNRDTLKGHSRPTEVHVLPSFYKRRDIHALRSQLERIKRQNRRLDWIEYEKTADGQYVPAGGVPVAEPAVNPVKAKKAPKPPQIVAKNRDSAVEKPASVAAQSPRVEPDDDFLDFLDDVS